jgi:predicted TIM-barrel fold metal-dependent hydrolase
MSVPIIDTDVHQMWESLDEIERHVPDRHRHRFRNTTGTLLPDVPLTPYGNPSGYRTRDDLIEEEGRRWTSPEKVRENHLDAHDVSYALLNGDALGINLLPNEDYAMALARAVNEWVRETWLPADDRFLASIYVPQQAPEAAADIIREYGDHPQFVQVIINSASHELFGKQTFWPLYEAAEEMGLPVAMHVASDGAGLSGTTTSAGHPSTYFEHHNIFPTTYMQQVNSLVCEGVFVEFPEPTVVAAEGGFLWAPHLMWRMDKNFKTCRKQVPWLDRAPSEYVRDHIKFTQQLVPEPPNLKYFKQFLEMISAEETLMFSSDFPHWDGTRQPGLPPLSSELTERIMYRTAMELYGLPSETGLA